MEQPEDEQDEQDELWHAAQRGCTTEVAARLGELAAARPDDRFRSLVGEALDVAALNGHVGVVAQFVGLNVLSPFHMRVALRHAAANDEVQVVHILLAAGASPVMGPSNAPCPVVVAAANGSNGALARLLAAKAAAGTVDAGTALCMAARYDHPAAIGLLVGAGVPADKKPDALILAAKFGNRESARALLRAKAGVGHEGGYPAAVAALRSRHGLELLQLLVAAKMDPNLGPPNKPSLTGQAVNSICGRNEKNDHAVFCVVRVLMEAKASADAAQVSNNTPLFDAVRFAMPRTVAVLLRFKANPNARDRDGATVLAVAARKSLRIVQLLVRANADLQRDQVGASPLYMAIHHNDKAGTLHWLLEADGRAPRATLLRYAAEQGSDKAVRLLCSAKTDLLASDLASSGGDARTPLMAAVCGDAVTPAKVSCILALVAAKADPDQAGTGADALGLTPLGAAIENKDYVLFDALMRVRANPDKLFLGATRRPYQPTCLALCMGVADDVGGAAAVHGAGQCEHQCEQSGQGAGDPGGAGHHEQSGLGGGDAGSAWCDTRYITPLQRAVRSGFLGAVVGLLFAGAGVDSATPDGHTALHIAAAEGCSTQVLHALLVAKADIRKTTCAGWTALHMAARRVHVSTTRVLLEARADVNATAPGGFTPLFEAVANRALEQVANYAGPRGAATVVNMLLAAGADPCAAATQSFSFGTFVCAAGTTPRGLAAKFGICTDEWPGGQHDENTCSVSPDWGRAHIDSDYDHLQKRARLGPKKK